MKEQKQSVVTPKVTVTVENDGKKKVSTSENAGICFLLHENCVEVVESYDVNIVDLARLIDAIMRYGARSMMENDLLDIMHKLKVRLEEKPMFSEGDEEA